MKFILLEDPKISSDNSTLQLKNSFFLINLDRVILFKLNKETGEGLLDLIDDERTFHLSKDEVVQLLKLLNDPKIVRPTSLDKIQGAIEE